MKINAIFTLTISMLLLQKGFICGDALPLVSHFNGARVSSVNGNSGTITETDLNTCEEQLTKYRRFLLQAIISFEDVCDAYNQRSPSTFPTMIVPDSIFRALPVREQEVGLSFLHNYQPVEPQSEIWAFFKLLMAQFDDVEFTNIIRNAVIERCHIKSQQRDEKRNSVVLGKKQRFHSWGGKRSQPPQDMGSGQFSETDMV